MASLMDDIMKRYYSGAPFSSVGGVVPASGAPTRDMFSPQRMGSNMPDRTLGSQPTLQQGPFGSLPQFNPMAQGDVGVFGPPMPQQAAAPMQSLPTPNIPMPPPRPRDLPGRTPGFLDQLLSGPNYQSNNMPVDIRAQGPSMPGQEMPIQSINWGDAQNPADFFRADQLMMQNPNIPGFLGGY